MIEQLVANVDDTWSAEQRAAFLTVDLRALRRATAVFVAVAFVGFIAIASVTLVGYSLLTSGGELSQLVTIAGVGIGLVVGVILSFCFAILVGSRLALAPPRVHQSIVVTAIVAVGTITMIAAQTLGGAAWLVTVSLGLSAWLMVEGAWQNLTVLSALRRHDLPRRALGVMAAQRADLGFPGRSTVLGVGVARESVGSLSRGIMVVGCAALIAQSALVGLLAVAAWLLAELADVAALTTRRRRLVSIAPAVAAGILVVAVAALY